MAMTSLQDDWALTNPRTFLACLYQYTGRAVALLLVSMAISALASAVWVCKMLKFMLKFFYVIGKVLSGEHSCLQTDLVET